MYAWLFLIGLAVIFLFSFVVLFGAPFLPTLTKRKKDALQLLDLRPGDTLLELGSGDGRMLAEAAKTGIKGIGYELNPLLVLHSKLICFKYRKLVTIKLANFWRKPLPHCDGIYVFLLNPYMSKLHNKITQQMHTSVKVVSFAFEIPEKKHTKELNGMFLYKYTTKK